MNGPSGVAIATLAVAAVGSFGAAGAALAAFFQAKASKVAAGQAADAARDAARIAGDAQKETARLAADLAALDEQQRWRRDALSAAAVELVTHSKAHTFSIRDNPTADRALYDQIQIDLVQLRFLGSRDVALAAIALVQLHGTLHADPRFTPSHLPTFYSQVFNAEELLLEVTRRALQLEPLANTPGLEALTSPEQPSDPSAPPSVEQ